MELVVEVYDITDRFPDREKFVLSSQIRRCAIYIPSNIAEGCRGSKKELNQFLNIAMGSSFELETQTEIAFKQNYIDAELYANFIKELNLLQRRINSFRVKIND